VLSLCFYRGKEVFQTVRKKSSKITGIKQQTEGKLVKDRKFFAFFIQKWKSTSRVNTCILEQKISAGIFQTIGPRCKNSVVYIKARAEVWERVQTRLKRVHITCYNIRTDL